MERVAEVLSSITAQIRSSANDGCSISAINEAQVGDFFAICELDISADITQFVETDAMAEAGAPLSLPHTTAPWAYHASGIDNSTPMHMNRAVSWCNAGFRLAQEELVHLTYHSQAHWPDILKRFGVCVGLSGRGGHP